MYVQLVILFFELINKFMYVERDRFNQSFLVKILYYTYKLKK